MKKPLSLLMAVVCLCTMLVMPANAEDATNADLPMGYACLVTHQKPTVTIENVESVATVSDEIIEDVPTVEDAPAVEVVPVSSEVVMTITSNSYEFEPANVAGHDFSIYVDGNKLSMPQTMPNGETYAMTEFTANPTFSFSLSMWVGEVGTHEIKIVPNCEFIGTGSNRHNDSIEDLTVTVQYVVEENGTHQHEFKKTLISQTCTEVGYIRSSCSCGSYIVLEEIPAGPNWDFGTVTVQPTETTTGEIVYTCYCCGTTKTETLEALGSIKEHLRGTVDGYDIFLYTGKLWWMTDVVNRYFTDTSNTIDNPAIVPAQKYEDAIRKHFVIDDSTINDLHNYANRYDAETETYSLTYIGGFGGLLDERAYFGYVANNNGTYDMYYRTITYQYLNDVLTADGATMDDVTISNGNAEYKGVVYKNSMDGYYTILCTDDNSGKKHTVELNGDIVRIISTTDYTETDLPDSFDDVVPHEWSDWTEIDTAGKYTRECTCGASEIMTIPQDNTINGTDTETNDAGANLANTDLELIENVLTEEEQSAVASGETVSINLVVEEFHVDEVPAEDKTKIEEAVEEIVSESDTQIIYLDIDLYKNIGGVETPVTETSGKIKITIDIPDELIDTTADREYKIIRVHDGEVELIEGIFDEETKKFTFETDKFSTYALTYVDTPATTYTVTYTDGVYGQVVFQDQTYTVEEGSATPAFVGTPNRYGYTFNGWTPAISETVTADTTYTATWTKDSVDIYIPVMFSVDIQDSENGNVSANSKVAAFGSTVKLTVVPDDGYELDTLSVKCGNREITTTLTNGTYKFTMPYANVSVTAVFKKTETPVVPDPVTPEPVVPTFKDVTEDAYYFEAVEWAVKNGITNGTGDDTFSPDAECTRAQMVTFLWRAAGSPEPKSSACQFTDVDVNGYYAKAVLWAVEEGITNGTSETTFSPDTECTRAQMATFLYRMAKGNAVGNNTKFVDIDTEAYYAPAVQWAVENAITNGTSDNTFSPDAECTRGQMVTFLYRLFGKE